MNPLTIKTADNNSFKVEFDVARKSQTIRTMLEDLNIEEDGTGEKILPLTNKEVTGDVFKKALVWMENNRGYPDFKKDKDDELIKKKKWNQLSEWENQYIEMPVEDMVILLVCGNFLEI